MIRLSSLLAEDISKRKVNCKGCNHSWDYSDGGAKPYLCHKCGTDNTPMSEDNDRVARKKGQKADSKKHSDLYTDENPKGTIHGLKFATVEDAEKSVSKIKSSGKPHAHKIQAAIAMEQRAKAAGKSTAAGVYRTYINSIKKSESSITNEVEISKGHENDRDMVLGVAEILRMVDDVNNRKEIAEAMLRKFKSEDTIHNAEEFLVMCGM